MLKFPLREIYSFHTLFTVLLFSNTQVLSLLTQPVARQAFRVALLFFMLMSISSSNYRKQTYAHSLPRVVHILLHTRKVNTILYFLI